MIFRSTLRLLLPLALAGCASGNNQSLTTFLSAKDPVARFAGMEEDMLNIYRLTVNFEVSSTGLIATYLTGKLVVHRDNRVDLNASGILAGDSVTLRLESDGTRMTGGNGEQSFDQETPKALTEAIVVGLTRMGILHNLARLAAGLPPDHSEGGVKEWVKLDSLRNPDVEGGPNPDLLYNLIVSGEHSASGRLWLMYGDLPKRRMLRVEFPEGTMDVMEIYDCDMERSLEEKRRLRQR